MEVCPGEGEFFGADRQIDTQTWRRWQSLFTVLPMRLLKKPQTDSRNR